MFFLLLMVFIALGFYAFMAIRGNRSAWRDGMRHGMGGAFLFTGIDHFVSLETRYLPMIPPYLAEWGVELVLLSGALEIAESAPCRRDRPHHAFVRDGDCQWPCR